MQPGFARSGAQSYNCSSMNPDLRERLRRLGVHKGAAHLKSSPPAARKPARESARVPEHRPGHIAPPASLEPVNTPFGQAYVRRASFDLAHRHGSHTLASALHAPPHLLASLMLHRAFAAAEAALDLHDAIFLDTETTGLTGGAGTLVFLVGLGWFEDDRFVIEQYFLRDPIEEVAMLSRVERCLGQRGGLVTFNGRSFDVPLLESRFILSRIAPPFGDKPHLDLLLPARRMWRSSLDSCSLGSLEFHLLGVRREQRDVPGAVIPFLYREYLAAGGGDLNEDMQRVMYHNLTDILSMVTLIPRLVNGLAHPDGMAEHFAVGRYYERLGAFEAAERTYRSALDRLTVDDPATDPAADHQPSSIAHHSAALRHLARCLKRQGKTQEALRYWQCLADAEDVEGLIELAKHYEWRVCDPRQACECARRAARACHDPIVREAIRHRLARLERKVQALEARGR